MRKPLLLLLTVILALAAMDSVRAEVIKVGGQRVILPNKQDIPKDVEQYWHVLGVGQTEEEAAKDAVRKARYVVADYMKQTDKDFSWTPSERYVQKRLVHGKTQRQQEFDEEIKIGKDKISRKWYSVPIGISKRDISDMQRQERNFRRAKLRAALDENATGRLWLLAKIVAFILAGCVLLMGYLRLEEKTKGYLTRWLVVTLVVLMVGAALSLFLFC